MTGGSEMKIGFDGIGMDRYQTGVYADKKDRQLQKRTGFANIYEDAVSEEEPASEEKEEAKTETDIIVKPDGSRVLVMTMHIGGMKTMMSLKVSEPTDMPNDIAGRESDLRSQSPSI